MGERRHFVGVLTYQPRCYSVNYCYADMDFIAGGCTINYEDNSGTSTVFFHRIRNVKYVGLHDHVW